VSARSILIAIALSAWLLASVVAFFIVAYMSFFGVAFIGLVICYVSAQFELDGDRPLRRAVLSALVKSSSAYLPSCAGGLTATVASGQLSGDDLIGPSISSRSNDRIAHRERREGGRS
jgi:hypothetical protein